MLRAAHAGLQRAGGDAADAGVLLEQRIRQVVGQTRRDAYAHHIQRLMVTGNFACWPGCIPMRSI